MTDGEQIERIHVLVRDACGMTSNDLPSEIEALIRVLRTTQAEVAQLQQEKEQIAGYLQTMTDRAVEDYTRAETAEARAEQAARALETYGQHLSTCDLMHPTVERMGDKFLYIDSGAACEINCTCGFAEATTRGTPS